MIKMMRVYLACHLRFSINAYVTSGVQAILPLQSVPSIIGGVVLHTHTPRSMSADGDVPLRGLSQFDFSSAPGRCHLTGELGGFLAFRIVSARAHTAGIVFIGGSNHGLVYADQGSLRF